MTTPANDDGLVVTLSWERDGTALRGRVVVRNTGVQAVRLPGKPAVQPLDRNGDPLPAMTVTTAEWRSPGEVVLEQGRAAAAPVSWASWCGPTPSDRALITWQGGSAVARVEGPVAPGCDERRPDNLSSSWFEPI